MNIVNYDYKNIKLFTLASLFWAIIGMGIGVFIAFQMVFPDLNFGIEWTTFGRLRPVHTSGVIFAFGGNVLFATSFYIVQRTCQTSVYSPKIVSFIFYSFQLFISNISLLHNLIYNIDLTKIFFQNYDTMFKPPAMFCLRTVLCTSIESACNA